MQCQLGSEIEAIMVTPMDANKVQNKVITNNIYMSKVIFAAAKYSMSCPCQVLSGSIGVVTNCTGCTASRMTRPRTEVDVLEREFSREFARQRIDIDLDVGF